MAENLRKISCDTKNDLEQLFRRIVFNALINNNDDHLRNHAFICKKGWQLSPAYDLTPAPSISDNHRDLALICGKYGRYANKYNLLSECEQFLLNKHEAETIIDQMLEIVRNNWYTITKSAGVTDSDCEKIKPSFVYSGFYNGP